MTTAVEVTGIVLPAVASAGFAALAWRIRRIDEPGVRWFSVLLAVFAVATVGLGLMLVGLPRTGWDGAVPVTIRLAMLFLYICAIVPWFLFALEYTGRVHAVPVWGVALVAAPLPLFLHNLPAQLGVATLPGHLVVSHVVEIAWLYFAGMLAIGGYLILRTTHRYGHLSLIQGGVLVVAMIVPLVAQRGGIALSDGAFPAAALTTELGGAYLVVALCFGLAITRLQVFESTPAAGNVGERAIASDTDDLIVVADHRDRIIKLNEATADALGVTTTGPHGDPISDLLTVTVEELEERQTFGLQTEDGKRRFDAQVSELTDQHGRWLGSLVSLRDVTNREIRKQRLEVLNRVLRHNLRNELNVVKNRTTTVADALDDPDLEAHLREAIDQVDHLSTLGDKAKASEELMADLRGSRRASGSVSLPALVEHVVVDTRNLAPTATFETDVPDAAIEIDPGLLGFALRNVVENAVEHAEHDGPHVTITATVDDAAEYYPTTIEVADDGPGIPDHEIDVLRQGHETALEHGSGLGLWVTNWALTELGGELSFEQREPTGTTVRIRLPHAPVPVTEAAAGEPLASDGGA